MSAPVRIERRRNQVAGTFAVIGFRDAMRFVWRGLPLALALAFAGVVLTWFSVGSRPDTYTATANLLSTRQEYAPSAVRGLIPASLDPLLYRSAVADGPVLQRAIDAYATDLPADYDLLGRLRITSDNQLQSSVVRIELADGNPDRAAELANLIAAELVAWDVQRTLQPLQEWIARLENELRQLEVTLQATPAADPGRPALQRERDRRIDDLAAVRSVVPLNQLTLLTRAEVPEQPDSKRLVSTAAIAMVVGVLLGYAIILLRTARAAARANPYRT